jgi:hypothetical protein
LPKLQRAQEISAGTAQFDKIKAKEQIVNMEIAVSLTVNKTAYPNFGKKKPASSAQESPVMRVSF